MEVGNVDLTKRLILAPMAEVSDYSFRTIAKKFGAGLTFTQMVSAKGVIENEFDTLRYLAFNKNEKPIGVQILGSDPHTVYQSVAEIIKYAPDIIDLNCGCPKDTVTKHRMGSCLLESPETIGSLVKAMYKAAEGTPVSAKFRLGYNRNKINIIENAKAAEDNGASMITLHARARTDTYEVEPEYEWLLKVKEAVSIPVVGNGSVFHPFDAVRMKEETGVDSVMVARGALGNPFLFQRYNSIVENDFDPGLPDIDKVMETALEHLELLLKEYGEFRGLNHIKKNMIWYYKFYPGIYDFIGGMMRLNSVDAVKDLIFSHTEKIINEMFDEGDLDSIRKKFEMKVLFWLIPEKVYSGNLG